jgi:hypothetical protein
VLGNTFRNPAILAKMATALDEVSQGRLILGLGGGWNEPEYRAFGLPFDHRASRLEEAVQILRPLLRDGHVDFTGRCYQALDCDDVPRGPLRPDKPAFLDHPLSGTPAEIAAAMRGCAALDVPHIMFQCEPHTPESLRRLGEAVHLYYATEQPASSSG